VVGLAQHQRFLVLRQKLIHFAVLMTVLRNILPASKFVQADTKASPPADSFTTRALPGIRTFVAKPHLDVDSLPITPPSDDNDLPRYWRDLDRIEGSMIATLMTVAPSAPPAKFVASEFLKTIISYKDQALKLTWIANTGVATSLASKLNATQAALQRGDYGTAKQQLNALLNEVNAQAGKHLTSEAVALLKFNTQY
jgi:hypothetical protein